MADLDGLRNRVEQIDLRLKTAHRAREKESAALMDMWEQIRARFVDQNAEITLLRDRVADLEDTRDDLLQMVHGLLSAVEGGLERMSDETVPQIKAMASNLLEGANNAPTHSTSPKYEPLPEEIGPQETFESEEEPTRAPNFHDDLLSAIEQSIENVRGSTTPADEKRPSAMASNPPLQETDEPASPGIRDLVARIENAVGPEFLDTSPEANDDELPDDDDLSRDLREIEALRGELNGLRERISSGR